MKLFGRDRKKEEGLPEAPGTDGVGSIRQCPRCGLEYVKIDRDGVCPFCGKGEKHHVAFPGELPFFGCERDTFYAGETVQFSYPMITDTTVTVRVDEQEIFAFGTDSKGIVYAFPMPDHDVTVTISLKNDMMKYVQDKN